MSLDEEGMARNPDGREGQQDDDNGKSVGWRSSWSVWIRFGTALALCLAALAIILQLSDNGVNGLPIGKRKPLSSAYPVVDPSECGTPQQRIENLMRWAKKQGAYIHPNITASTVPNGGRGLVAKGEIRKGDVLFQVPPHLLLSLKTVKADPTFKRLMEEIPQMHDGFSGLAVYLIHEAMNKTSFWRPYLCSLPEWVPLPLFWTEEKRMEKFAPMVPIHQRDHFKKMSRRLRRYVDGKYYTVMPALHQKYPQRFKEKDYSGARWGWAGSLLLSRTWAQMYTDPILKKTTGKESIKIQTLVPAADLPNHKNDGSPGKFQTMKDGSKSLRLDSSKHHNAGDQVFISYGAKCDAEYLASYGFVPEGNSGAVCHAGNSTGTKTGKAALGQRMFKKLQKKVFGRNFRKALKKGALISGVGAEAKKGL